MGSLPDLAVTFPVCVRTGVDRICYDNGVPRLVINIYTYMNMVLPQFTPHARVT
jgi:hypothetical protein